MAYLFWNGAHVGASLKNGELNAPKLVIQTNGLNNHSYKIVQNTGSLQNSYTSLERPLQIIILTQTLSLRT